MDEKPLVCPWLEDVLSAGIGSLLPKLSSAAIAGFVGPVFGLTGIANDILSLGEKPEGPAGGAPLSALNARGPLGGSLTGVDEEEVVDLGEGEAMTRAHRGVGVVIQKGVADSSTMEA